MPDDFGQRLPYLMRRVSNALSRRLERTLKDFSLNHAKLAALAQLGLCHPDGLSSAELGHRAGVTAQSMSAAVATLLEQGFVTRAPHPDHGRILEVRITDAGMDLLERAQVATKTVDDRALADLSAAQQRSLRNLLRQLMATLDLYLPEGDDAADDDRSGDHECSSATRDERQGL